MIRKYFLIIYMIFISYLMLSNSQGFGDDKYIKTTFNYDAINNDNTTFFVDNNLWVSSYYFYNNFGKDIKLCLFNSSNNLIKYYEKNNNSRSSKNKINKSRFTCPNIGDLDNSDFNFIVFLKFKEAKFEKKLDNYKEIGNYKFNFRYGNTHDLLLSNILFLEKI